MSDTNQTDDAVVTGELVEGGQNESTNGGPAASEQEEGLREEIDEPTRLLRIAGMVKGMLSEVETTELDSAARERLSTIHDRAIEMLRGIMSEDLSDELDHVAPEFGEEVPSGAELQVAQAQLAGWLEGLFHGIQASVATRRLAQASPGQLNQMLERGSSPDESSHGNSGQYL